VTADPLIDVATLAALVGTASPPTLLDVRWRLGGPSGAGDYAAGHLPGAVFIDLDSQLCGPPGGGGRHPLPDPDRLAAVLRAAGVRTGHPVVVYDAGDGSPTGLSAARAWWTLRWVGHQPVRVLDGGFAAWVAAGHQVTRQPAAPVPGDVTVRPGGLPVLDAAGAATVAADGVLIDVRAPERYRGEQEPIDPVAGHIPGAVNLPTTALLTATGGWQAAGQIRDRLRQVGVDGARQVGAYCGSGVAAAHTILALHRAGRTDAVLYVGSWSHWVTDPGRPVATGHPPGGPA
jgi:thiosulfate/3-mercaptopyruvate sulfurtransferase